MVSKETIDYIITKTLLLKCSYTLKGLRGQISPLIKQITDNDNEYNLLVDSISHFIRDNYNNPNEVLIMTDYDGNDYHSVGDFYGVEVPDKAKDKGENEGLIQSGHNHPDGTCFQSMNDFKCIPTYNQKYSWTFGDDGLMIVKNSNIPEEWKGKYKVGDEYSVYNNKFEMRLDDATDGKFFEVYDLFNKSSAYDNDELVEYYFTQLDNMQVEWYRDNMDSEISFLNERMNKLNIESYHIPILKNYSK